jgi:sulfur carrier protein
MTVMNTLDISLNGKRLETDAATLQALLVAQGYELQSAFACAINSSFVPRTQWAERSLQAGDRVDVITPIAGG